MTPLSEHELTVRAALAERLVSSYPGRRLHLELTTAELRGGGRIEGRVHRDRPGADGALRVSVRCVESWRTSPRPGRWILMSSANAYPSWRQEVLCELSAELEPLADAHWRGFAFDLPEGLPPAVEGRTVAWRYEIEARRAVRFAPDDRAVLTPLGLTGALRGADSRTDPRSTRAGVG